MSVGVAWPAQVRSQVAPVQLTEQDAVHSMWQVEPAAQVTLELGPTVAVQVEPPAQLRSHEFPQLPVHVFMSRHSSVQLPPSVPQVALEKLQVVPGSQEQLAPVHARVGGSSPPQAARARPNKKEKM